MVELYNTLSGGKEEFSTEEDNQIKMYCCGPTVYDYIHIGNARTFLAFDVIKRYLKYKGFDVKHVQNITDVGHLTEDEVEDDKILQAAEEEDITPIELAEKYTEKYQNVMERLNWDTPDIQPKATDLIDDMIETVEKLVEKGYGYEVNGNVYFDITKFDDYGKLSGNTPERLEAGASERVDEGEKEEKRNPNDFALWFRAPEDHAMKWESPWSTGYPGWHIECAVMSSKYFEAPLDLHAGGKDLIFPHHENEIAQFEAAYDEKFVNYWLHSEFLLINGEKMSKSEGNFFTAEEFVDEHGPMVTRFLLISKHYKTELNINDDAISEAKESIQKLKDTILKTKNKIEKASSDDTDEELISELEDYKSDFVDYMDDDFNTSGAIASIFEITKALNKYDGDSKPALEEGLSILNELLEVLGIELDETLDVPEKVKELVEEREEARKAEDWSKADELREEINEEGFIVEDSEEGPIIKNKN